MAIAIRCPDCGKSYNLADEQAGQRVRCRACSSYFDVTERVEHLETVPADGVAERREARKTSRLEEPERPIKKPRRWGVVIAGVSALLAALFLACGGGAWVVVLQTRKHVAQMRAQMLADLARANEEARRAERDKERAELERQKLEQAKQQEQLARLAAEGKLAEALAKLRGEFDATKGKLELPDLTPIKDLDDALAKLKAKNSLTKIKAMSWITEKSPYNAEQKKRVLDALQPLTKDPDAMVAAGATQTQLIVEQDL